MRTKLSVFTVTNDYDCPFYYDGMCTMSTYAGDLDDLVREMNDGDCVGPTSEVCPAQHFDITVEFPSE